MCLNLNIIFNHLPKAVLNHQRVLFNKNSKVLVKLYLLAMESVKGKYLPFTTKLYPSQKVFSKSGCDFVQATAKHKKIVFLLCSCWCNAKVSNFKNLSLISNVFFGFECLGFIQ